MLMRRAMFLALPAVLLFAANVQADVYDFSYVGIGDPSVFGSGTFTTGTPYGDGYVPILSISGITDAGAITGLETSGGGANIDPANGSFQCCAVGPGGDYYYYDNAFSPSSPSNPFSMAGLLFDIAAGNGPTGYSASPVNLFSDGSGNSYRLDWGYDTPNFDEVSDGGVPIRFTATLTPEPSFYGTVGLCIGGLVLIRLRRRQNSARTV
ncbi:MAG TPA: hypothetical protein VGL82_00590 [Bryobacteraceae bacterium]|jgi:hypothetical protein